MSALVSLARKDARIVYRDGFLVFLPLYSIVLALVARLAVPFVPIERFGLYVAPAIVLFGTILLGTLLGFALIEEREQGTWLLLRVLPIGEPLLFLYSTVVAGVLSAVVSLVAALVYGLPASDPVGFIQMVVVSSTTAPLIMLILGVLASNKIEGLAVNKITNLVLLLPGVVFVLPMPWQLVAAWCPWYWLYLGLLEAYAGNPETIEALYWPSYPWWLVMGMPVALSLAATLVLARVYVRRAA